MAQILPMANGSDRRKAFATPWIDLAAAAQQTFDPWLSVNPHRRLLDSAQRNGPTAPEGIDEGMRGSLIETGEGTPARLLRALGFWSRYFLFSLFVGILALRRLRWNRTGSGHAPGTEMKSARATYPSRGTLNP